MVSVKRRNIFFRKKDIDPLIQTTGDIHSVCIYDTEYHGSSLRVFIDKKGGCINLQDCERFLNTLKFLLEGEGIADIPLEVSSPGLTRPLKKKWHFESAVGKTIQIYTSSPISFYDESLKKQKRLMHLKALLYQCQDHSIILAKENKHFTVPFHQIKKANTVFDN